MLGIGSKATVDQINRYSVPNAPGFDAFNEFVFTSSTTLPVSEEDFRDFAHVRCGLSFAVHILWLFIVFPGSMARLVAAKDMPPVPIRLVSMKNEGGGHSLPLARASAGNRR